MLEEKDYNDDTRLVFRPTKEIHNRLYNLLLNSGQYKHLSEVIRHVISVGLDEVEKGVKK